MLYRNTQHLWNAVERHIKRSGNTPRLVFSMYKDTAGKAVEAPAFDEIFAPGVCTFFVKSSFGNHQYLPVVNPTWGDVLVIANSMATDGSHVYLELITHKGDGRYEFFFGS